MGFIQLPFTALKHLFFQNANSPPQSRTLKGQVFLVFGILDISPQLTPWSSLPAAVQSDLLLSSSHGAWQLCSSPPSGPSHEASSPPKNWKGKGQMTKSQNLELNGALHYVQVPGLFLLPFNPVRETEVIYGSPMATCQTLALCLVRWINLILTTPLWGRYLILVHLTPKLTQALSALSSRKQHCRFARCKKVC